MEKSLLPKPVGGTQKGLCELHELGLGGLAFFSVEQDA